ncbi:hypothetical protein [Thiobacillus sp.]|uniref:hypothetical protein n=1 Tax=Thiobacillus sp. TaxID=924 RepID=UPI0025D9A4A0|nr:hypothetical protein [Thiobacillus sp.]
MFQAAKRRARGFTRIDTIKTVIFLIAGRLDFHAINPLQNNPLEINRAIKVNLRNLAPSWRLYGSWQHASLLASIAHAASSRIYRCIIAPDYSVEYIPHPHGSHPWLNSYFGADFLEILTGDMEQFSRLEKVRFLSTQPGVLDALRVCWDAGAIPQGYLNCGRCLKCVRTMLAFMACGQLATTKAFPFNDVSAEMMRATPSGRLPRWNFISNCWLPSMQWGGRI